MKALIKRYRLFLGLLLVNLIVLGLWPEYGQKSVKITGSNLLEMLSVLPPIFIFIGLLDVWVERETMMQFMGEKSGLVGVLAAFLLGSAAAGPLYAAFPIAAIFLKKGCKFSNVLIFIGAWSTTKIPMLLFETSAMGWRFMLTRFLVDIPGIALIAYFTEKLLSKDEIQIIYGKSVSGTQS